MLYTENRSSRNGFTLIELLVVVGIISILALLVSTNFRLAKHRAKISKALSDMKTIQFSVESYYLDHGSFPPDIDGFIPFILTDSFSKPVAYLNNNRQMQDPLNDIKPTPKQWRFQTYRYINIKGRLAGMPALNSNRNPNDWLPINLQVWQNAHNKYGDYLIASTNIKYKENFKKDDSGRSKALAKWNEFFWKPNDKQPKFMELKHEPLLSQKLAWSGMEYSDTEDEPNEVQISSR